MPDLNPSDRTRVLRDLRSLQQEYDVTDCLDADAFGECIAALELNGELYAAQDKNQPRNKQP